MRRATYTAADLEPAACRRFRCSACLCVLVLERAVARAPSCCGKPMAACSGPEDRN